MKKVFANQSTWRKAMTAFALLFLTNFLHAQTSDIVLYGNQTDLSSSGTNYVLKMNFTGLDRQKASQVDSLASAQGYKALEVNYATGFVTVAGDPNILNETSFAKWVLENLMIL